MQVFCDQAKDTDLETMMNTVISQMQNRPVPVDIQQEDGRYERQTIIPKGECQPINFEKYYFKLTSRI